MNFDSLREWLASVVADLRARHLLPVLALLIVAAIVLPFVLSKSGTAQPLAALPPATSATTTAPSLGTSTPTKTEPAQNYLTGPGHDPFDQPKTSTTATPATSSGSGVNTTRSSNTTSSGTSGGGSSTSTVSQTTTGPKCPSGQTPGVIGGKNYCVTICRHGLIPVLKDGKYVCETSTRPIATTTTTTTTTKTVTSSFTDYAADVTFGPAGQAGTVHHHLARYQLLPNDSAPVAEFLGVRGSDRKTAVFWVSGSATITGNARCTPAAAQCNFVSLSPGGTFYLQQGSAEGGGDYRVHYDSITKLTTNGAYVVDSRGRQFVNEYKSQSSVLQSLSYSADTGLMSIDLGTAEPTAHAVRASTGAAPQSPTA